MNNADQIPQKPSSKSVTAGLKNEANPQMPMGPIETKFTLCSVTKKKSERSKMAIRFLQP
jgi:hypothetical protein